MSTHKEDLTGISDMLSLYPAIARFKRGKALSTHGLRILLAIYYIKESDLKPVSRNKLSVRTYLWPNAARAGVDLLISWGYIEPLKAPKKYIHISELGYTVIREILFNARAIRKSLTDPAARKVVNKPKKRAKGL